MRVDFVDFVYDVNKLIEIDKSFLYLHFPNEKVDFQLVGQLLISSVQKLNFLGYLFKLFFRKLTSLIK